MSEGVLHNRIDNLEKGQDILNEKVGIIKDNHLVHIQDDITGIKVEIGTNGNDLKWLKKFFWVIATAAITASVAGMLNLVITALSSTS